MGVFKRRKTKKSDDVQPVGCSRSEREALEYAAILRDYDLVEVIPNTMYGQVVVVAPRTDLTGLADPDFSNNIVTFTEPSHVERATGLPVGDRRARAEAVQLAERRKAASSTNVNVGGYGSEDVNLNELGTSSPSPWTSWLRREYNNDLLGSKGLRIYDQMRRSDGVIRGSLRGIKTPVLSARWFIEPCTSNKAKKKAGKANKNAAEFVWRNLTEYMSIGWNQFLTEAMLMADFGYYMFEIVWEDTIFEGEERIMLKKLAPRHPMDVKGWLYDENGGPNGVVMYPNSSDGGWGIAAENTDVVIPIEKLLVFTFDREAGNIEGISALRSAYKHWYYKDQLYKIDAIQKERHGIGVPLIILPVGFSEDDKRFANELGRNIRTNERAHVVLPFGWDFKFAELKGNLVNALESIKVHDAAIRENFLMNFMESGTQTNEEDQMMFLKSTRFIASIVCDTINQYLIPKIIAANFKNVDNPQLKARRIGEQADWRTLSFAIRNLIGAGAMIPDDPLEDMLRDEMDLPAIDEKTRRNVITPQNQNNVRPDPSEEEPGGPGSDTNTPGAPSPGAAQSKGSGARAGMPRQTANAGRDGSGG